MLYLTIAVLIIVILLIFIRIYKIRAKRVFLTLDILTSIASITGYFYLLEKANITPQKFIELTDNYQRDSNEIARIAAIGNYLFARNVNSAHKNMFNSSDICDSANEMLIGDEVLLELVIQSIRMTHLYYFHKTNNHMSNGLDLLEKHGKKLPESPNPESYKLIIKKCVSLLHDEYQKNVTKYIFDTWPKFYKQFYSV